MIGGVKHVLTLEHSKDVDSPDFDGVSKRGKIVEIDLPHGKHNFYYLVDGEQNYDRRAPIFEDDVSGITYNVVTVRGCLHCLLIMIAYQ